MSSVSFPVTHNVFRGNLLSSYKTNDVTSLKSQFDEIKGNTNDKKSILDQAFRDVLLEAAIHDTNKIEALITLSIAACRLDIATSTIPVVLLGDVFDAVTLDQCERMFTYVEKNVSVWKENWFFQSCKNNLLRMCNDLLKRLSRAQNTVFCGRILLFLATFFPFSERSGLNIISEFNLENRTEFENDAQDVSDELNSENKQVKIDYNLYCKFWALQDFFRNPNQCYDLKEWKIFSGHVSSVLSAFASFKLEETTSASISNKNKAGVDKMSIDEEPEESQHFFAKFLTNPKLLALQLSDSNFRRSVLVQCLILFQYLTTTVKFKTESHVLSVTHTEFIKETEAQVYKLLEETPPNGKKFSKTVHHMLKREELWNNWKNDGCKEFKRAEPPADEEIKSPTKKQKRNLGDAIRDATKSSKFYMGNPELTRLWNLCPDNLQACRGEDRNFLPSIESYLENPKDKADPSYEWRALRLLARQSPHFFTLVQTPSKVSDYLEMVRKKIHETKSKNHKPELEIKSDHENDLDVEKEDGLGEEQDLLKSEQLTPDDRNVHKTTTATEDQLRELSVVIGNDWKRLATKLGFSPVEIKDFADAEPTVSEQCRTMLKIWFEDDDANLDNLCYILDGLELNAAADTIKRILEPADKMEDISE